MVAPSPIGLSQPPAEAHADPHRGKRRGATGGSRPGRFLRLAALPAVLSLLLSLLLPVAVPSVVGTGAVAQEDAEDEAAPEGEPPAGEYTVAITEDDVPSDLVNGPDLIGRWQIFLRPDGSYVLRRADVGDVVTGSYTVDGETITLTDEDGLLSCVNALPTGGEGGPPATGTYGWELGNEGLLLRPVDDGCASRRLILSTRPLDFFVACETEALQIPPPVVGDVGDEEASDDTTARDPDEATEEDEEAAEGEEAVEEEVGAGQDEEEDGGFEDPFGRDDEGDAEEDAEIDPASAEEGIDAVLAQLTACWTTQDPARILPLFGSEFLDTLVEQAGSLYDVAGIFGQIMAIPITWERAGEIDLEGTEATALVSQTIGGEESFVRFRFVFEDGTWKLASFG